MTQTMTLPEGFIRHASLRGGVFTTASARSHGVHSAHLKQAVAEGQCHRIMPSIYSLRPAADLNSRIWAGLLHVGQHATLGGPAAAWVRGQGPEPEVIDIWCGHRQLKDRLNWSLHRGQPPQTDDAAQLDAEFSRLAMTADLDEEVVITRTQQLLRLADRERFLSLVTGDRIDGLSMVQTHFVTLVELRHGLPRPVWHTSTGPDGDRIVGRFPRYNVSVAIDLGSTSQNQPTWLQEPAVAYVGDDIQLTLGWWDLTTHACRTGVKVAELLWRNGWLGIFPECQSCNVYPFVPTTSPVYGMHAHAMKGRR